MNGRRWRDRISDTSRLSGWLYADLLLALMVIFLVTSATGVVRTQPKAPPTPTPTITPTPTLTPTPSPTPPPRSISKNPLTVSGAFHIDVAALRGQKGAAAQRNELNKVGHEVHRAMRFLGNQQVGVLLTFVHITLADTGDGVPAAKQINDVIRKELPYNFQDASLTPFLYVGTSGDEGTVDFWFYLYTP